ncbi:MAG: nuclear transport factor 2 family protein [Ferruginibacter sp.]
MQLLFKLFFIGLISVSVISCRNTAQPKTPVFTEQDSKKVIERELSSWEFAKTRNFPALRETIADDYIGYFGRNVMHANDVIKLFQSSIVRSYHLSNIRVHPLTENVAIVYYELNQDIVDANGQTWTPLVASSSTYVKRKGIWQAVFYQETVLNN